MPLRRAHASVGANRGARCATFSRDGASTVWCGGDGAHARGARDDAPRTTRTTRGERARATCVETLDDGRVVVGDADGRVRVDAVDGTRGEAHRGAHARGPVRDVAAATREAFVTCADDGRVVAWATPREGDGGGALRELGRLTLASADAPLCCAVTRAPGREERRVLAVGCVDGRTRVYACDFTNEGSVTFEACGILDGHADWVRGVAFAPTRRDDAVFLATASQDRTARVWRVRTVPADGAPASKDAAPFARLAAPPEPPSAVLGGRRVKTSLESLLIGHEDWVTSVAWHPDASKMVLMTASMDRSLVLWSPAGAPWTSEEAGSELWMSSTSLGEAAAVCLGYYGASFSPDGDAIMANSHGGALHLWRRDDDGSWRPIPGTSGHTMRVTCLCWDTAGRWLMSGGRDQTVRVHAPWHGDGPKGWRQIARPQVHGHDIVCFATMHDDAGTTTYVSGADEKVLRVFEAPGTFLGTVVNSLGNTDSVAAAALTKAKNLSLESLGAELPALGLSNKALRGADAEDLPSDVAGLRAQAAQQEGLIEEYNARGVEAITPQALTQPPLEEVLAQATLWPETRKLVRTWQRNSRRRRASEWRFDRFGVERAHGGFGGYLGLVAQTELEATRHSQRRDTHGERVRVYAEKRRARLPSRGEPRQARLRVRAVVARRASRRIRRRRVALADALQGARSRDIRRVLGAVRHFIRHSGARQKGKDLARRRRRVRARGRASQIHRRADGDGVRVRFRRSTRDRNRP